MTDLASSRPDGTPDLAALPLERLRAHRATLLEESARAARWRRLVQARLDLAVDAAAPVEPLRGDRTAGQDALVDALTGTLVDAVRGSTGADDDPVELLRRADRARAELLRYATRIRSDLDRATGELVDRYTDEPSRCLSAVAARQAPGS